MYVCLNLQLQQWLFYYARFKKQTPFIIIESFIILFAENGNRQNSDGSIIISEQNGQTIMFAFALISIIFTYNKDTYNRCHTSFEFKGIAL